MNKLKNDKLITDFMEAFVEEGQPEHVVSVPLGDDVWFVDLTDEESAQFETSLDWSIPVLEKIENMGYQTDILNRTLPHIPGFPSKVKRDNTVIIWDDCRTYLVCEVSATRKAEAVYMAILAFIKWLNQQTKKEDAEKKEN